MFCSRETWSTDNIIPTSLSSIWYSMRVPVEISTGGSSLSAAMIRDYEELNGCNCEHGSGYQVANYLAKIFASLFAEVCDGNQVYTCVGSNQVFGSILRVLREAVTADCALADAAKIEEAVMLDGICDLGVAVGGAVLQVRGDRAVGVETKDKAVAFGSRL